MALTRIQVEASLIAMSGSATGLLQAAGFATTATGRNPDLNQPIWTAMRTLGYAVANPMAVSDLDLTAVANSRQPYLIALADVLNLENILSVLMLKVDQEHAPDTFFLGQMAKQLQKTIDRKWKLIEDRFANGQAIPVIARMACGKLPPDALCVPVPRCAPPPRCC